MRRAVLIAAAAACAPDVPANPTWTEDVMPIMRANCVRCHGEDPAGAPTTFYLDRWASAVDIWGYETPGAFGLRGQIGPRIEHEGGTLAPMPPNGPSLSDRQKEIIVKWAEIGGAQASLGPANAPPTIRLGEPLPANADEEVTIRTLVEDPDRDFVGGEIWVGLAGPEIRVTDRLRSGVGTHVWDAGTALPGTYQVFARLFDHGQAEERGSLFFPVEIESVLGQVTIAHAGGTAPRVTFKPARGEETAGGCSVSLPRPWRDDLFHPSFQVSERTIVAFVDDPDGDPVTVDFEAIGPATIDLGAATITECRATLAPDLSLIPDGASWRIRATARDGTNMRQAVSDYFIVSNATTTLGFAADIEAIVRDPATPCSRCEYCHGEPPTCSRVVEVHVDSFGIQAYAGRIYRKVVEREEMPPESARIDTPGFDVDWLTRDERDLIGQWILGGAPP